MSFIVDVNEDMSSNEYPLHDVQQDSNALDCKGDEQSRKVPYTMHGVLHYLQHEWSRYEMDRAQWEMERAELQARISFLHGERKGQENLKADLIRRIKMLEYSLKQERAKNYRLTHNGQDKPEDEVSPDEAADAPEPVSLDVDAYSSQCNSAASFRNARALLRQYLQEIGYSETILDVRSFRAKNLLGVMSNSDWQADSNSASRQSAVKALQDTDRAIMEAAQYLRKKKRDNSAPVESDDSDSEDEEKGRKGHKKDSLDPETVDALGEFSFLKDEKTGVSKKRPEGSGEWSINQRAIDQMKEKFRSEQERKRSNSQSDSSSGRGPQHQLRLGPDDVKKEASDDDIQQFFGGKSKREFMDINAALGISDEGNVDIKDDFIIPDEDTTNIRWNLKFTLRSHFDSIRAMQFHPVEPVLITASEDSTAKLWNLGSSNMKVDLKGNQISTHSQSTVTELEPTYTFRGHNGPILSMDMSPTGDMCYTGGFDGVVCCWSVPSVNTDIYEPYDSKVLCEKLKGHTSAIWSVAFHSSDNRLVSASADGTIKLWEPGNTDALIKSFGAALPNIKPTSVDFVSTEPQQLLAAYTLSYASIIDMETGCNVLSFDFGGEDAGTITKILSHPTMSVSLTASNDRKIRYFDNNTGKMIHGTVAHVEAISCLAIDPNGLYLLSGSHDGSLRLWNMEKRICLQEIAAHRKKFDSAVMTVAFHPSRPLIGSAGADALAKVFSSQKYLHGNSFDS
uniref:WD_REPEATS_REGION domain-containing protein n=1 Tax=Elaeophora elaphi TaxID=1147741 RepID=A0A0R3RSY3_9BILA